MSRCSASRRAPIAIIAAPEHRVTAVAALSTLGTLKGMVGHVREWWALHKKERWLTLAQQHAADSAKQNCPVSRLFKAEISMTAKLEQAA